MMTGLTQMMCAVMRVTSARTESKTSSVIPVPQVQDMVEATEDITYHTAVPQTTRTPAILRAITGHLQSRSLTDTTAQEIMAGPLQGTPIESTRTMPTMRMGTSTAGAFPMLADITTRSSTKSSSIRI